jgi:hypothetical protein
MHRNQLFWEIKSIISGFFDIDDTRLDFFGFTQLVRRHGNPAASLTGIFQFPKHGLANMLGIQGRLSAVFTNIGLFQLNRVA